MLKVLLPVDGSENSLRTVQYAVQSAPLYREPAELHLLNVQRAFPSTLKMVGEDAKRYHHDEGIKALEPARKLLDAAGIKYTYHIGVGDFGETIAQYVRNLHVTQIVMGCRGASSVANMLLGSVTTRVLHLVEVPVLLVK